MYTMLQLRTWPDEGQLEHKVASNLATFMCVATSIRAMSAASGPIIVDNDSIEGNILGSFNLHL